MSRESYLLYIDVPDDPGALWTGLGWLDLPADEVLPAQTRFLGGGGIVSLPDFQQLINGVAERLSAGVSGVSLETLRLALEQPDAIKNVDVNLGRVTFDVNWQNPIVTWIGLFRCDKLTTDRQAGTDGNPTRTISLSIGTDNTGRSNAPIALFTAADQAKRSTDDTFFDGVSAINAGTSRRFRLKDEDD